MMRPPPCATMTTQRRRSEERRLKRQSHRPREASCVWGPRGRGRDVPERLGVSTDSVANREAGRHHPTGRLTIRAREFLSFESVRAPREGSL